MQQLRKYQQAAVEQARDAVRGGARRLLVQGPTGSGKNTVAAYLISQAASLGKRAVFLVHRRSLITQMAERLKEFGADCGIVMNGVARTNHPIQLVSRDTLFSRAARNDWMQPPPADLVLVDEAHQAGKKYETILSWYRSSVLVGLTATPAWPDGRGMGEPDGPYQRLIQTVPTTTLVREGYLVPVTYFCPPAAIKMRKNGGSPGAKLAGDPVTNWLIHGSGRPTVLFAATCDASRAACKAFLDRGITAEHVDGDVEDEDRAATLARLTSGVTKVVCSVGTMVEGVDLPPVSCIILLRKAASIVTYLQAVGRGMRPHPGKKDLVVIDHSSASLRHGYADEDFEWSLDPKDSVERRTKQAKKDGKMREPIVCLGCSCVFSGLPACPVCGKEVRRGRDRKAISADEVLVKVQRDTLFDLDVPPPDPAAEMRKAWARCRGVAAHRGQKARAAQVMFRNQFRVWPEQVGMADCPRGHQWEQPAALVWPNFARGG